MRFEVPQFIEIEDKIFGPFTWRQFVYLAGGLGVAVVSYIMFNKIIFIFTGLPIIGLAFVLAFYPINNQPFSFFLESVFHFYNNHRTYYWKRNSDIVYRAEPVATPMADRPNAYVDTTNLSNDINSLSRKLELNALENHGPKK